MRRIVFDVPAEHSGALTILEQYYNNAKNDTSDIEWIFVISKPSFAETENIKVLKFPWIKKSWLHRLFFDHYIAPKLVKKYKVNEILSLQNVIIPRSKGIKQTVYLHQALPFIDYRFGFFENRKMWIYQNLIGRIIKRSIKNADSVIVQTNWMKKACILETKESSQKFIVEPPLLNLEIKKKFKLDEDSKRTFFYPAGASYYKNHRIIIDACIKLKEKGFTDFKIILTIFGNESDHVSNLLKVTNQESLPVSFVGKISKSDVYEYYSKAILLFPSYIESSPLPLSEGKAHETIIIASNCSFSKEILQGYEKSRFFDWKDSDSLVIYMIECMNIEI